MKIAGAALVGAVVLIVSSCASSSVSAQKEPLAVNAYGAAIKDFRDRAAAYLALHRKVAETVPPLKQTDDSAQLSARGAALGEAIRQARVGAKPGDLFGPELTSRIRDLVKKDWAKRSSADRAGLREEIPPATRADVNTLYPTGLPLATFPASLLTTLPPLPEQLEYRFIGRHLIVRDVNANLIVDVLPNVLPGART